MNSIAQYFIDWTKNKIRYHLNNVYKTFYFREKEIWWAAMGQNIGFEVNGKHQLFERPVLIIKKYSEDVCFILPLSTKIKNPLPWYQIEVDVDGTPSVANITQGRTISSKRLLRKIVVVDKDVYKNIIKKFTEQFYQ